MSEAIWFPSAERVAASNLTRFARETFAPAAFRLDVATFNQRAIRVYERAGFVPGRRFMRYTRLGQHEFMEMTRVA